MYSSLQERCELEFERYVARARNGKPDRFGLVDVPVPWARSGELYPPSAIPQVIDKIRAAMDARIWFSKHGPTWGQPLPLGTEYSGMIAGGGPLHVLGLYALSLEINGYEYLRHPQLYPFGCGIMALSHSKVADDPDLLKEFPPTRLFGLCSRGIWLLEPPETPRGFPPGKKSPALSVV